MNFNDLYSNLVDFIQKIRDFIFGEKYSRLYSLLDRYYSLRVEKRPKYLFYFFIVIFLAIAFLLTSYFVSLRKLQNNLNVAVVNLEKFSGLKYQYKSQNEDFKQIESILKKSDANLIIADIEDKAKEMGIELSGMPSAPQLYDLKNSSALFEKFQLAVVDFGAPNASLKQIIDFVNSLHKMPNRFRVTGIEIHQKFNNKLYFDASFRVEAYVNNSKEK